MLFLFFFFQAEDGIRDIGVTGVQTCALPIYASHDLKTPLTLVQADAEVVLHRGSVTEEDRQLIEHALGETNRMSKMLSDLLFVARLDAGKVPIERKPLDRKSTRLNSSHANISYAVFCLK